jgi:hypothetical protein
MMHLRPRPAPLTRVLLVCWATALTACTASAPSGPANAVSTPDVGRPPPPPSVQAALSREPFTPYAALGESDNDGLAPGESSFALAQACLTAAGYPDAGNVPFSVSLGPVNLAFAQPWGDWGYLGLAEAEQYGFRVPPGSALTILGIDAPAQQNANPDTLPAAEQSAIGKCGTISDNFANAVDNGALAGVATLSNDIVNDVLKDAAVKHATQAWTACMGKNGYSFRQPETVFFTELAAMHGGQRPTNPTDPVSAAANQAQIAAAASDASCTQSTDLAGLYFAVEASYEQQLVSTNAQALTAAVRQYRAAYAKELNKLPSLLRTAKATPLFPAAQAPGA